MPYQPIENYGVIGDMQTVALVGMDGSVDWFCFPRFDSPAVFAAILDDNKGGRFRIAPDCLKSTQKQLYWPETNVLISRFLATEGVGEIRDFMPTGMGVDGRPHHLLMRQVRGVRGSMCFELDCRPAFNFARDRHETRLMPWGASFESATAGLSLASSIPLTVDGDSAKARFTLHEGQTAVFALGELRDADDCRASATEVQAERLFEETVAFWRRWIGKCRYSGRWREMVHRSALALKLLTYEPSGAIVAAATSSLPEEIGGVRNWDYRYTWIRDAAFTVYAFLRLGFTEEAARFTDWVQARSHELNPDSSLQVMYGIDGRHELTEETLDHLEGYRGSRPVRVGNGAYNQLQLDIYGELMDSIYLYNKYGSPISYDLWTHLVEMMDWVIDNWRRKDEGIWEVRGGQKHFVYSKLMCWVALDRAIRLADKRSFPADRQRWLATRDEVYRDIMTKGWNSQSQAFVQHYDCHTLDAANLLMPLVFFVSPTDERMLKTLDAISRPLDQGGLMADSLVYRYNVETTKDGLTGEEGTFNMCTFWLVEAMTRAGHADHKRLDAARLIFEKMLGYANHLGLYAEETGPTGEALGNFPQAFTHLSLISAAFNLDKALDEAR